MIMSELLTVAIVSFLAVSDLQPANNEMIANKVISLNFVMPHILQKGGNNSLSLAPSPSTGRDRKLLMSLLKKA